MTQLSKRIPFNRASLAKPQGQSRGNNLNLNRAIQRAMLISVSVSLSIATAWMAMGAWYGAHQSGNGWSQSAARGLQATMEDFALDTEFVAKLSPAERKSTQHRIDQNDFLMLVKGRQIQDLNGHGAALLSRQQRSELTRGSFSRGYLYLDGRIFYAVAEPFPEKPGSMEVLMKDIEPATLDFAKHITGSEIILAADDKAILSTLSDKRGNPVLPEMDSHLTEILSKLPEGQMFSGKAEFPCQGYAGFMFEGQRRFDIGKNSFKAFYSLFPLYNSLHQEIGYGIALVSQHVMLDGVKQGIAGSMMLLCLLCVAAVFYSRRIVRRFLAPLSDEILRIRNLYSDSEAPSSPEERVAHASSGELETLRLAVTEAEHASQRERETMRLLDQERARLAFASKMASLGEMASGVAHEINTPLAVISTKASQIGELLAETPLDLDSLKALSAGVFSTTERIAKIVKGLRSFAKDGSREESQPCSLKPMLEEVLSLCSERFRTNGVGLILPQIPERMTISCRSAEIMQVLLNLLNNAYDAVKALPQKWVRLELSEEAGFSRISVTDSGSGIPAAEIQKIFQPFFTTKEPGHGTGLGLSISRGIAQSHGGSLALDPDSAHTSFVLSLPLAPALAQEPAHAF